MGDGGQGRDGGERGRSPRCYLGRLCRGAEINAGTEPGSSCQIRNTNQKTTTWAVFMRVAALAFAGWRWHWHWRWRCYPESLILLDRGARGTAPVRLFFWWLCGSANPIPLEILPTRLSTRQSNTTKHSRSGTRIHTHNRNPVQVQMRPHPTKALLQMHVSGGRSHSFSLDVERA